MYPARLRSRSELERTLMEMGGTLGWEYERQFSKAVKKQDNTVLRIIFKQVEKIFKNPNIGKRLKRNRKGQLEVRVAESFRLYYSYFEKDNMIVFLEFSHKDDQ